MLSNKSTEKFQKKSKISVSVVIVTRNRLGKLKRCIKSLLINNVKPKEIIIVDESDIGKDSQMYINQLSKKNMRIKFIFYRVFPPRGVSYLRNIGIKEASGKIVAFLDDDCIAFSNWVEEMIKTYIAIPETAGVTGHIFPLYPNNYWNKVLWLLFLRGQNNNKSLKETDFLEGANFSLKKQICQKDRIYFNSNMIYCSEDRYISHLLAKKGHKMFCSPNVKVFHEYRTTALGIFKQWLRYGISDYYFWKLTPDYHDIDSDYFRTQYSWRKIAKAPLRILSRILVILKELHFSLPELHLTIGLFLMFFSYYIGIYVSLMKDNVKVR